MRELIWSYLFGVRSRHCAKILLQGTKKRTGTNRRRRRPNGQQEKAGVNQEGAVSPRKLAENLSRPHTSGPVNVPRGAATTPGSEAFNLVVFGIRSPPILRKGKKKRIGGNQRRLPNGQQENAGVIHEGVDTRPRRLAEDMSPLHATGPVNVPRGAAPPPGSEGVNLPSHCAKIFLNQRRKPSRISTPNKDVPQGNTHFPRAKPYT